MDTALKRFKLTAILLFMFIFTVQPNVASSQEAPPDSAMALKGGEEGTAFGSLTIEGEDRVRIEFDRPVLSLDLDPVNAPGLDWDNTWDVLGRCSIDFISPLIGLSATQRSPYMPRPWFEEFSTGDVVRFRPALKNVDRWKMTIADSRSRTVAEFEGKGNPPDELGWDGRSIEGNPMPPGLTYSYVLEAYDRAGNKRNFVGEGFQLPSYQIQSDEQLILMFSADELGAASSRMQAVKEAPPAILLDAASRLNQLASDRKVCIEATARTYNNAKSIAQAVAQAIGPLLLGDTSLIQQVTRVEKDAPAGGTVAIIVSR
ncbi:MAG: hypothetical protein JSV33_09110 [bacterium]|nr:MAG: hypothetical protein JSV33_09110 [bacterium]